MITKTGATLGGGDSARMWKDRVDTGSKGLLVALGAGMVIKNYINKIQNDTRRKALIEDLMLTDPIISHAPKDQVMSFYATINNVAPSIAVDKNVVRELLQYCIKFGTINLEMIKMLAETHGAIDKNKSHNIDKFLG